jgi:hypothetical protein
MVERGSKLARLTDWVRQHVDRKGNFMKSALYAFARDNDMERSALAFVSRCRQHRTMRDRDDDRIEVLVPRDKNLDQFYKNLLKIKDKPVLQAKSEANPQPVKDSEPSTPEKAEGKKERETVATETSAFPDVATFAEAVAERLADKFKRIDDSIASVRGFVEYRVDSLEKNLSLATVQELEQKIAQLERQLQEFREKAETFDLIKRDTWEVIQALDIVEVERDDVKKALKKFL